MTPGQAGGRASVKATRSMPDDLYVRDILEWSERQADLLRRVANGERVNEVDWPNVIEEITDVGGSALSSVRSLLRQAMIHLIKIHLSPSDLARDHWTDELETFLDDAAERFAPSMRQRIDIADIYAKSMARFKRRGTDAGLPPTSPWTLDDLLAGDRDMLLAALATHAPTP
jgi:hypothetical protein